MHPRSVRVAVLWTTFAFVVALSGCGGAKQRTSATNPTPPRGAVGEPRSDPATPPARRNPTPVPLPPDPPRDAPPGRLTAMEMGIINEMNLARREPAAYARFIEERLRYYDGKILRLPGLLILRTEEGARAADEAIRVLRAQQPVGPLTPTPGMTTSARDHVHDQGPRGVVGHDGSDGSTFDERVRRYGRWGISLTENISYGPSSPRDVVIDLIVDDGVRDRGHRHNIFDPVARVVGVACGRHTTYGYMCVMDFAGSYTERTASGPSTPARTGRPRP
jgi:cysteine-rich secretory family protein